MKNWIVLALVVSVMAGMVLAHFKCKACDGTGWKGIVRCWVCRGSGEV